MESPRSFSPVDLSYQSDVRLADWKHCYVAQAQSLRSVHADIGATDIFLFYDTRPLLPIKPSDGNICAKLPHFRFALLYL